MTHFIGGHWRRGTGPEFESLDPATGERCWTGREATSDEVAAAVDAARAAFPAWARRPLAERLAVLERYADALRREVAALGETISLETGKPLWESKQEVAAMAGKVAATQDAWRSQCAPKTIDVDGAAGVTTHRPLGVLVVVGPFNFPGHMPNGHIVPALLAGNTVVFKPSEQTPRVGEHLAQIWERVGLPAGVLELVQGGAKTGAALAAHPGHDGVLFTGGRRTGLALARALSAHPEKMLALEMGGNNPLVVWDTVDLDAAAQITVRSAFITAGQRCTGASRLILAEGASGDAVLDALVQLASGIVVGRFTDDPEPFMGPVIDAAAASRLMAAQEALLAKGAKAVLPMRRPVDGGAMLTPGIVDVTGVSGLDDEEVFGPLLRMTRVPDFDAAIEAANDTRYGLSAALLSDDASLFERFDREVRAGVINWNCPTTGASGRQPFGGVGWSGNHRAAGFSSIAYCVDPVASLRREGLRAPAALPGLPSSSSERG